MALFDFIFQSGEFYQEETDFGFKELIINTIFPIVVFSVGFYISHIYKRFQKKKELVIFREYYEDTVKFINRASLIQAKEFANLSNLLIENDSATIEFKA